MMEELYSFAKKEMPFSFKVIKDTNYISELKKITPLLKKSVGIFPFGEHRNLMVKTYNEFTLDFFKRNNLRPKNKVIQTKFSFDIENKRERKRPKVFLKIKK